MVERSFSTVLAEGTDLDADHLETTSRSPEETQGIGRHLGSSARPGDLVLLFGELGAGKTCLTQGILWGLGADDYARSPTFVMVSEYRARMPLYHVDLYRLEGDREAAGLGLEEYLEGDGLCVVEWAERAPGLAGRDHLAVRLEDRGETTRLLTVSGSGRRYAEVLAVLRAGLRRE